MRGLFPSNAVFVDGVLGSIGGPRASEMMQSTPSPTALWLQGRPGAKRREVGLVHEVEVQGRFLRHELQGVLGAQQHEAVRVETAARASAGAPVPTGTAREILGACVRKHSAERIQRCTSPLMLPDLEWSHEEMVLAKEVSMTRAAA